MTTASKPVWIWFRALPFQAFFDWSTEPVVKFKFQRHFTGTHFKLSHDTNGWQAKHGSYWSRKENFDLQSFALFVQARPWFRSSMWISSGTGISKIEITLFTSVVARAAGTYLRMKDILMRLCANFLWCVPSQWIENVWFLLAITASKRRNVTVLFDPYLFEARLHYFVFLYFFSQVATCSKLVPSRHQCICFKISRQAR